MFTPKNRNIKSYHFLEFFFRKFKKIVFGSVGGRGEGRGAEERKGRREGRGGRGRRERSIRGRKEKNTKKTKQNRKSTLTPRHFSLLLFVVVSLILW